jgi:hypothetical protein
MSRPLTDQEAADRKALEKLAADSGDDWEVVETDEPTPQDPQSQHRALVRLLKANLAAQAVTARVLLKHDTWIEGIRGVWTKAKKLWPAVLVLVARPEIVPEWIVKSVKFLVENLQ